MTDERGEEIRRAWLRAKWNREADLLRAWEVRGLGNGMLKRPEPAQK